MTTPVQRLRVVVDTLAVPLAHCDRDLTYRWVSGSYAAWLGRVPDQVIGKRVVDVLGPDASASIQPYIDRVLTGERVEYEQDIELKGLGRRRVHSVYMPTFDSDAVRADGWMAVVHDVTEERQAARAVRQLEINQHLLSAIVESADDAIVSKDLTSTITSWNGSAERIFGYSASEAVGQTIRIIVPDDRQLEEDDILARVQQGERIEHFHTVRKRKDGRLVPVSLTISPVRLPSGEIIGMSKVARDISEEQHANERAAFLTQVAAVLAGTLDYESTLKTIANLAVPYVADWCANDPRIRDRPTACPSSSSMRCRRWWRR